MGILLEALETGGAVYEKHESSLLDLVRCGEDVRRWGAGKDLLVGGCGWCGEDRDHLPCEGPGGDIARSIWSPEDELKSWSYTDCIVLQVLWKYYAKPITSRKA